MPMLKTPLEGRIMELREHILFVSNVRHGLLVSGQRPEIMVVLIACVLQLPKPCTQNIFKVLDSYIL